MGKLITLEELLGIVAIVISGVAIVISGVAFFQARRAHRDITNVSVVGQEYSEFNEFSELRLQYWELAHLFELPGNYLEICKQLRSALGSLEDSMKQEYLLKERGVALRIFTVYEQTIYLWKNAVEHKATSRSRFLKEVLDYFTGRVLRNPRLLFLWDSGGGNLQDFFEQATRDHYKEDVILKSSALLSQQFDPYGPFLEADNDS